MKKEVYKELARKHLEKIKKPFDIIYKKHGFEVLYDIIECFGKTNLYVSSEKTVFADCISEQMCKEYNGFNIRELATRYEFCETTVKRMVDARRGR